MVIFLLHHPSMFISWFPVVRAFSYLSADSCFLFDNNLLSSFWCSYCPRFGQWELLQPGSLSFWHVLIILWVEFTFGYKRMFETFLTHVLSLLQLWNWWFLHGTLILQWRMEFITEVWTFNILIATKVSLLKSSHSRQS